MGCPLPGLANPPRGPEPHQASCFFTEEMLSPWTSGPQSDPPPTAPPARKQPPEYPGCVRAEVPTWKHIRSLEPVVEGIIPKYLWDPSRNPAVMQTGPMPPHRWVSKECFHQSQES